MKIPRCYSDVGSEIRRRAIVPMFFLFVFVFVFFVKAIRFFFVFVIAIVYGGGYLFSGGAWEFSPPNGLLDR